jgi:hypothetical protein
VRRFRDHEGNAWVATVAREEGGDYKGRFYFVLDGEGSHEGRRVSLTDVRWNSSRTAERTLATMSEVELRRRLRSAIGRASSAAVV